MIVPAEIEAGIEEGLAGLLQPCAKIEPALDAGRTKLGNDIGAIDGFHAERPGNGHCLLRVLFEQVEAEMAGRHGQAVAVEIGLERIQRRLVEIAVNTAEPFDFGVAGPGKRREHVGKRRIVAGAVKLEAELGHIGSPPVGPSACL